MRNLCKAYDDIPIICIHTKKSGGIFNDKSLFINFELETEKEGAKVSDDKLTISVLINKNTESQIPVLDAYLTSLADKEICGYKLVVLGKMSTAK